MTSKARDIADLGSNDVLETTSTGLDVTGTVTADGLTGSINSFSGTSSNVITANNNFRVDIDASNTSASREFAVTHDGGTKALFNVNETGDVSFYEDTGTTAKMVWSSSAESLNFGSTSSINEGSGGDLFITNTNAGADLLIDSGRRVRFNTGGTERMRIDSAGNVGIGTASPSEKLEVASGNIELDSGYSLFLGSDSNVSINSTSSTRALRFQTGATERARIDSSGNLLVGTTSSINYANFVVAQSNTIGNVAVINNTSTTGNPYGLQVRYNIDPNNTLSDYIECYGQSGGYVKRMSVRSNGGIANYQANDVNLSDERVKKDITPIDTYWNKIKDIEIVKFKYKDQSHDDYNIGVIAQQVESVAPEFVDIDGFDPSVDVIDGEEPIKAIYTADLYHASIKALQEAMERIEQLETRIETLENN